MSFFNFLCLFSVTVLINCHTISKSIADKERFDDISDSLNVLDYTSERKQQHKLHHKYRRDEKFDDTTTEYENTVTAEEKEESTNYLLELLKSTIETIASTRSTKSGFWKRFHNKDKIKTSNPTKSEKENTSKVSKDKDGRRCIYLTDLSTDKTPFHESSVDSNENSRQNHNQFAQNYRDKSKIYLHKNQKLSKNTDNVKYEMCSNKRRRKSKMYNCVTNKKRETSTKAAADTESTITIKENAEKLFTTTPITTTTNLATEKLNPILPESTFSIQKHIVNNATIVTPYKEYPITTTAKITCFEKINNPPSETSKDEDLQKTLTTLTTKLNKLKMTYDFIKTTPFPITTKFVKPFLKSTGFKVLTTPKISNEDDFDGTADVEAMLSEIKRKTLLKISNQSPIVTDMIINTATETSFEYDPILTHLDVGSPSYSLNTFVSISDFENFKNKTIQFTTPSDYVDNTVYNIESTHKLMARSITEDVITVAQGVEDVLQRELKKFIKKVKNKVCSDFHNEVKQTKSTIKHGLHNMSKKISTTKKNLKSAITQHTSTPKSSFVDRTPHRNNRNTTTSIEKLDNTEFELVSSTETTSAGDDDYLMLTLFEQMLTKTHDNSVFKLFSAPATMTMKERNENLRLNKRNPESLADWNLRENIRKIYEGEGMPQEQLDSTNDVLDFSVTFDTEEPKQTGETTDPKEANEDLSFEGLSNKLSYKDYVNGYKHYLKFQREQGNQNFSNLVRYQAHKHHKVDDIGKNILSKIPQLPSLRSRRYLDEDATDDQDASTKSDDSWFKKHFYLFIDTAAPKKYHTSQTVSFKYPVTEKENVIGYDLSNKRKPLLHLEESDNPGDKKSAQLDLEDLSNDLENKKSESYPLSLVSIHEMSTQKQMEQWSTDVATEDNLVFKGFGPHFIDDLFRIKGRRTLKQQKTKTHKNIKDTNANIGKSSGRSRRNTEDSYVQTVQLEPRKSTVPTDLFAQAALESSKYKKKLGYVSVDIVPKPTAIVNLRNANARKTKSFLNFFRYGKPKNKKGKRDINRAQMFNVIKKLKHMFKNSDDPSDKSDDNVVTSHVDYFKPVKYDKTLSMEEMRDQIPNITDDIYSTPMSNSFSIVITNKQVQDMFDPWTVPALVYKNYSNQTTKSYSVLTGSGKCRVSPKENARTTTTNKKIYFTNARKNDDIMNVKVKMMEPVKTSFQNYSTESISPYTPYSIEDVKQEIEKLQLREENDTLRATSVPKYNDNIFFEKKNDKSTELLPYLQEIPKKNVKIKNKTNKIPKTPLYFFLKHDNTESVADKRQLFNYQNNGLRIRKQTTNQFDIENNPFNQHYRLKKKTQNPYIPSNMRHGSPYNFKYSDELNMNNASTKTIPDYFSDLIIWHNDLLSSDIHSLNPSWQSVLKNIQEEKQRKSDTSLTKEWHVPKGYVHSNELLPQEITSREIPSDNSAYVTESSTLKVLTEKHDKANINTRTDGTSKLENFVDLKDTELGQVIINGERNFIQIQKEPLLKTEEVIGESDKLQIRSPNFDFENKNNDCYEFWQKDKVYKKKKQYEPGTVVVDTTLLAYDDDLDYLENSARKLSKNSLTTSTETNKATTAQSITKINTPPEQYYSTPLPMKIDDFEKFLKENQLDVESVTSPIGDMPKFVDTWTLREGSKSKGTTHVEKTLAKNKPTSSTPKRVFLTSPKSKFNVYKATENKENILLNVVTPKVQLYDEDQSQYLDQLVSMLTNDNLKETRLKRHNKYSTSYDLSSKTTMEQVFEDVNGTESIHGIIKRKIKFFDKKTSPTKPSKHSKEQSEGAMDITIINIDDDNLDDQTEINNKSDASVRQTENSKETIKAPITQIKTTIKGKSDIKKTKELPDESNDSLHNHLIYNNQKLNQEYTSENKDKITTKSQFKFSDIFWDKSDSNETLDSNTINPHESLFKKLQFFKNNEHPKSLQISSHTYNYNIMYGDQYTKDKNGYTTHWGNKMQPITVDGTNESDNRRPLYFKRSKISSKPSVRLNSQNKTLDRINDIIELPEIVDAVDHYTKPNVNIYIDLPTYYSPDLTISVTISPFTKSTRNDGLVKYVTNIILFELLNKCGITFDGISHFTDGADRTGVTESFSDNRRMHITGMMTQNKKWCGTRYARSAKSSESISTDPPVSRAAFVFDLKRTGKTKNDEVMKKIKYQVVLLKLLPILEERLKKWVKNSSATAKQGRFTSTAVVKSVDSTDKGNSANTEKQDKTKANKDNEVREKFEEEDQNYDYGSEDSKENLAPVTTNKMINKPKKLTNTKKAKTTNKVLDKNEGVYVEASDYDNQIYYEPGLHPKDNLKAKTTTENTVEAIKVEKRDVPSPEVFTAKDVAALEIIVDLMRNTLNYEEKEVPNILNENSKKTTTIAKIESTTKHANVTNVIQVHIAIPYSKHSKKRSLEPIRLRKVFSAKMLTPVNMEYQIHSFEGETTDDKSSITISGEKEPFIISQATSKYYVNTTTAGVTSEKDKIESTSAKATNDGFENNDNESGDVSDGVSVIENATELPITRKNIKLSSVNTMPIISKPTQLLSPGMYVLVDNAEIPISRGKAFALKPVKNRIDLTNLKVTGAENNTKIETTTPTYNLGRITLNKDFIAALNKQLVQLYENVSTVKDSTLVHDVKVRKTDQNIKIDSLNKTKDGKMKDTREINWNRVKKLFGHDRVCNCKCKENQTMCSACAASDAVITELTFEFDNLAKYMSDHCTEIQTYFWMNPSGGRKLREIVQKIDKNLRDYYKRAKGKCQGRTCNAFSTYLEKRAIIKQLTNQMEKDYIGDPLIKDLERLADDIEKVSKLKVCFNEKLIKKGEKLVNSAINCISTNLNRKRSVENKTRKGKLIKNVYSLDNINVNIICNPEASTEAYYGSSIARETENDENPLYFMLENTPPENSITTEFPKDFPTDMFNYDIDEIKSKTKRKGVKCIFHHEKDRKKKCEHSHKKFTRKTSPVKIKMKRQLNSEQIERPLIIDTGGSFWFDYLNKGDREGLNSIGKLSKTKKQEPVIKINEETKVTTKVNKENQESTTDISKVAPVGAKKTISAKELRDINMTVKTDKSETTTEENNDMHPSIALTHNINEILKLFGSSREVDEIKDLLDTTQLRKKTTGKYNNKKTKTKKTKKPMKSQEKNTFDPQTNQVNNTNTDNTKGPFTLSPSSKSPPTKESTDVTESTDDNSSTNIQSEKAKPTTRDFFKRFKSATLHFLYNSIRNDASKRTHRKGENRQIVPRTPRYVLKRVSNTTYFPESSQVDVVSNTTTTQKDFLIIHDYDGNSDNKIYSDIEVMKDDYNEDFGDDANYKDLLLSIIKYEANKLNDEWHKYGDSRVTAARASHMEDEDMINIQKNFLNPNPAISKNPSALTLVRNHANGDYDIVQSIKQISQDRNNSILEKIANKLGIKMVTKKQRKKKKKAVNNYKEELSSMRKKLRYDANRRKCRRKHNRRPLTTKSTRMEHFVPVPLSAAAATQTYYHHITPTSPKVHVTTGKDMTTTEFTKTEGSPTTNSTEAVFETVSEACEPSRHGSRCICDLRATFDHVVDLHQVLPRRKFEKYVKAIKCFKYRSAPKYYLVDPNEKKAENNVTSTTETNSIEWDWIRNKRSLLSFDYNDDDGDGEVDEIDDCNEMNSFANFPVDDDSEYYERLYKGEDGVYRRKGRSKRGSVDMTEMIHGLKNLPPFPIPKNEIYVMLGDPIKIECIQPTPVDTFTREFKRLTDGAQYMWKTDRENMLKQDNVLVEGTTVNIRNVQPKNVGNYVCSKANTVLRNVRLTVITLPNYDIVFTPVYEVDKTVCTYDDLKAMQYLSNAMSDDACSNDVHCSMRIDEPVCLKDKLDGSCLLKVTAVVTSTQYPEVKCSAQCRRDLQCSMALLLVSNAPVLSTIGVVISARDIVNKTLEPTTKHPRKWTVTHTLRNRDTNHHHEYNRLSASLGPGDVDIVISCPGGYYLVPEHKICVVCPAGTWSVDGDNTCTTCPRGTRSDPGENKCRLALKRPRRYDWWYPWCGYCVACCCVLCGCCACAACALLAHVTPRTCSPPGGTTPANQTHAVTKATRKCSSTSAYAQSGRTRPLSPSRVLLARFFRGSPSSSRVTDSQETKFEIWKEKNIPPPLPPIDFEF